MQPVTAAVEGGGMTFQHYSSGVFSGGCGMSLDHGVTVVGYGKNEDGIIVGVSVWLMKIPKDVDFPEGLCGIAMYDCYPVVLYAHDYILCKNATVPTLFQLDYFSKRICMAEKETVGLMESLN
ncbi:hypothetical protein CerSpe_139200 [Prunus speciosa]